MTAYGSASGAGCSGSPTRIVTAVPRRRLKRPSTVWMRWLPHTATGTSGTRHHVATAAAPGRKGRSSHEREIVASGKIPTTSPALTRATAWRRATAPFARSTATWPMARMARPTTGGVKTPCLARNRTKRPRSRPTSPTKRKSRKPTWLLARTAPPSSREVLRAAHLDAQAEHREDGEAPRGRRGGRSGRSHLIFVTRARPDGPTLARRPDRPLVRGAGPLGGLLAGSDETRLTPPLKRELACV